MGLTIHYSNGKAQNREKVDACIEFLKDTAKRLPCEFERINQKLTGILEDWINPKNPKNGKPVSVIYKGIVLFLDEGSESLCFAFDYDTLEFCSYFVSPQDKRLVKTNFFCKTQYAKNFLQTHHTACKLLEFVKNNYVRGLRVSDEGEYFDKWNKRHLQKIYKEWSGLISSFGKALDKLEISQGSDIEQSIREAAKEVYKDEKLKKLFG